MAITHILQNEQPLVPKVSMVQNEQHLDDDMQVDPSDMTLSSVNRQKKVVVLPNRASKFNTGPPGFQIFLFCYIIVSVN